MQGEILNCIGPIQFNISLLAILYQKYNTAVLKKALALVNAQNLLMITYNTGLSSILYMLLTLLNNHGNIKNENF